jgi:hypothetical protein
MTSVEPDPEVSELVSLWMGLVVESVGADVDALLTSDPILSELTSNDVLESTTSEVGLVLAVIALDVAVSSVVLGAELLDVSVTGSEVSLRVEDDPPASGGVTGVLSSSPHDVIPNASAQANAE